MFLGYLKQNMIVWLGTSLLILSNIYPTVTGWLVYIQIYSNLNTVLLVILRKIKLIFKTKFAYNGRMSNEHAISNWIFKVLI